MNQVLFVIDGWPVHLTDALIGFAVLALVLLLTITIVVARSGRRETAFALAQSARADELEERLTDMLRAQAEASGRVDAMAQALAGRQADMARGERAAGFGNSPRRPVDGAIDAQHHGQLACAA
jgi:DNA recombination protein RmuC